MKKREVIKYWEACRTVDGNPSLTETNTFSAANSYKTKILSVGCDEVVIYYNTKDIMVVVGGSSADKAEWFGNLTAYKTIDGCHKNYYLAAKAIWEAVVDTGLLAGRRRTFNGHSRGGAIAQVLRGRFSKKGRVVSFGAPKPFTKKATKALTFSHHCFIAQGDFVPLNPFKWLPGRFTTYATDLVKFKRLKWRMEHIHYGMMIRQQM